LKNGEFQINSYILPSNQLHSITMLAIKKQKQKIQVKTQKNSLDRYWGPGVLALIAFLVFSSSMPVILSSAWSGMVLSRGTTELITPSSSLDSQYPDITLDAEGNVHVVWQENSSLYYDIYYKMFNVTDETWIPAELVSTGCTYDSIEPAIAVDADGNVNVVWTDKTTIASDGADMDIFYNYRSGLSGTWNGPQVVSTTSTTVSEEPDIVVDAIGDAFIVWTDYADCTGDSGSDADIFYKHRVRGTGLFDSVELVSIDSTTASYSPAIAIDDSGNIHVTWDDLTDYGGAGTDRDIFYSKRTIGWSSATVISTASNSASYDPAICIDNLNNIHIAWRDFANYLDSGSDFDIFYKNFNSTLTEWGTTQVISTGSPGDSNYVDIAADSQNNIYCTWMDNSNIDGAGTDNDIFIKIYNASLGSWSPIKVVSSGSTGSSIQDAIAVSSTSAIHVVWVDDMDYESAGTDNDIFYRKLASTTDNTEPSGDHDTEDENADDDETDKGTIGINFYPFLVPCLIAAYGFEIYKKRRYIHR
jgi:hypothetical protein